MKKTEGLLIQQISLRILNIQSFATYQKYFGSWNISLEIAGLLDKINKNRIYTNTELLYYLKQFYEENGRPPTRRDFNNDPRYPNYGTYKERFGSWDKSLELVGLDVDSIVRKEILETTQQKGRFWELCLLEYFGEDAIDLSGKNCNSPIDGICPKKQTYDAKSSALIGDYWAFNLDNVYREEIEWFYLWAFNKNWTKLLHVWRISGNFCR